MGNRLLTILVLLFFSTIAFSQTNSLNHRSPFAIDSFENSQTYWINERHLSNITWQTYGKYPELAKKARELNYLFDNDMNCSLVYKKKMFDSTFKDTDIDEARGWALYELLLYKGGELPQAPKQYSYEGVLGNSFSLSNAYGNSVYDNSRDRMMQEAFERDEVAAYPTYSDSISTSDWNSDEEDSIDIETSLLDAQYNESLGRLVTADRRRVIIFDKTNDLQIVSVTKYLESKNKPNEDSRGFTMDFFVNYGFSPVKLASNSSDDLNYPSLSTHSIDDSINSIMHNGFYGNGRPALSHNKTHSTKDAYHKQDPPISHDFIIYSNVFERISPELAEEDILYHSLRARLTEEQAQTLSSSLRANAQRTDFIILFAKVPKHSNYLLNKTEDSYVYVGRIISENDCIRNDTDPWASVNGDFLYGSSPL